jgi:hypothetical protein
MTDCSPGLNDISYEKNILQINQLSGCENKSVIKDNVVTTYDPEEGKSISYMRIGDGLSKLIREGN